MPRNKVLIVEDSRVIGKILTNSIESRTSFKVECVKTLKDAVQTINDTPDDFFVAVLDLNLPDAPNGEIVDITLEAGIPPIILTGNISDDRHDEMMEKPIIDYVIKQNLNEIDYVVKTIKRLKANIKTKVLVVDDSKSSRALISSLLKRHYFDVYAAQNGEEALVVLSNHKDISLVITDYNMPNMDGVTLTSKIRDTYTPSEMSIIGISTVGSGSISVKFLKSGANDFISRPFLNEEFYCRINQNLDSVRNFQALINASNQDFLTGLHNRNYLFIAGKKLLQNAKRKNISLTIAIIDIDNFKEINSKHGHEVGDDVLKHVASVLSTQLRDSDVLARIGSEEFCILSVNLEDENTELVYERYQNAALASPLKVNFESIPISLSIGYSKHLRDTVDNLLDDADTALIKAKALGPSSICCFSG